MFRLMYVRVWPDILFHAGYSCKNLTGSLYIHSIVSYCFVKVLHNSIIFIKKTKSMSSIIMDNFCFSMFKYECYLISKTIQYTNFL